MEFKTYQFEANFIEEDTERAAFVVPITVQATSYKQARGLALIQAQDIVKINDENYTLFMRLEKV